MFLQTLVIGRAAEIHGAQPSQFAVKTYACRRWAALQRAWQ